MVILSVDKIAKSFGGDTLFSDVTFEIKDNDKFGFIGPNGAGKTTLFRILTGQTAPDGGAVVRSKGLRVGYMRQMVAAKGSVTGYEEALSVFEDLIETENALLAAEKRLENLGKVTCNNGKSLYKHSFHRVGKLADELLKLTF